MKNLITHSKIFKLILSLILICGKSFGNECDGSIMHSSQPKGFSPVIVVNNSQGPTIRTDKAELRQSLLPDSLGIRDKPIDDVLAEVINSLMPPPFDADNSFQLGASVLDPQLVMRKKSENLRTFIALDGQHHQFDGDLTPLQIEASFFSHLNSLNMKLASQPMYGKTFMSLAEEFSAIIDWAKFGKEIKIQKFLDRFGPFTVLDTKTRLYLKESLVEFKSFIVADAMKPWRLLEFLMFCELRLAHDKFSRHGVYSLDFMNQLDAFQFIITSQTLGFSGFRKDYILLRNKYFVWQQMYVILQSQFTAGE